MGDFKDLVRVRRSIRQFAETKLKPEEVVTLMNAALLAPTSKGKRPCEFLLVDEPILLHQLAECKPNGAKLIESAALAIVVLADPEVSDIWVEDASVASTHLLLQAEDMGLGACWVQVRRRTQEDGTPAADFVRDILSIPSNIEVLSIIAVGHKVKPRPPYTDEDVAWEKTFLNKYGVQ